MKQGIEWQVTSPEWSKKLKELGVKQESLFYWLTDERDKRKPHKVVYKNFLLKVHSNYASFLSAFTVAELVETLGNTIHEITRFNNGEWSVYETPSTSYPYVHMERATTLIEALAKMLCYLLENGLLKIN